MTFDQITYVRNDDYTDNAREVIAFIGDAFYHCTKCGGYGEFEGEYGPEGCQLCNSRLVPFYGVDGTVLYADWGDTLQRSPTGLLLHKGEQP